MGHPNGPTADASRLAAPARTDAVPTRQPPAPAECSVMCTTMLPDISIRCIDAASVAATLLPQSPALSPIWSMLRSTPAEAYVGKASPSGRLRMAHSNASPLAKRTAVQSGSATICRPSGVSGIRARLGNSKLAMGGTFQEFGSWSQSGEGVSSIVIGIIDGGRTVSDAERAGTFRSSRAPSHSGTPTGGSGMTPVGTGSGILHPSGEADRSATTIAGLAGAGSFVRGGASTSATKRLPPIATQASTE